MRTSIRLVGLAAAAVLGLAACSEAPVTGRDRITPVSQDRLAQEADQIYREELSRHRLSNDDVQTAMVRRVGQRIAAAAENPPEGKWRAPRFDWQFALIEEPQTVNAFCLPGGKIAVYSGILPVAGDETGLGIIVGHEVAHALLNHHGERASQQMAVGAISGIGGAILGSMIAGRDNRAAGALIGAGAGLAGGLVLMSFGRDQESEADRVGLILAAAAGYDPRAAIGVWERMRAANTGGRPPEFLSTHPSEETRIANIRRHLPEAMQYYRPR